MRLAMFVLLSILALSYTAVSAGEAMTKPAEGTRIEVNADESNIQFYIDGELSAVLTGEGLHARKGIFYGGQIVDYGNDGFGDTVEGMNQTSSRSKPVP